MREYGTPFFLGANNMNVDPTNRQAWFKNAALGKNSLGNLMKAIANEAGHLFILCMI